MAERPLKLPNIRRFGSVPIEVRWVTEPQMCQFHGGYVGNPAMQIVVIDTHTQPRQRLNVCRACIEALAERVKEV